MINKLKILGLMLLSGCGVLEKDSDSKDAKCTAEQEEAGECSEDGEPEVVPGIGEDEAADICSKFVKSGCISGQIQHALSFKVNSKEFFNAEDLRDRFDEIVEISDEATGENYDKSEVKVTLDNPITNSNFADGFDVAVGGSKKLEDGVGAGSTGLFLIQKLPADSYTVRVYKRLKVSVEFLTLNTTETYCATIYQENQLSTQVGQVTKQIFDDLKIRFLKNECGSVDQSTIIRQSGGTDTGTATTSTASTSKALSYSNNFEIAGVKSVYSVTKFGDSFYFAGLKSDDVQVVGKIDADDQVTLTSVASIATAEVPIAVNNGVRFYLPSNLDVTGSLYLIHSNGQVLEVNLSTMQAIGMVQLESFSVNLGNNNYDSLVYLKDSRWNSIQNSTRRIYGKVDGSLIEQGEILDPFSKAKTPLYHDLVFDGNYYYNYSPAAIQKDSVVKKYAKNFELLESYSTTSYIYDGFGSRIVSVGSESEFYMFGCQDSKCYRTKATVVVQ